MAEIIDIREAIKARQNERLEKVKSDLDHEIDLLDLSIDEILTSFVFPFVLPSLYENNSEKDLEFENDYCVFLLNQISNSFKDKDIQNDIKNLINKINSKGIEK
jgi:hypothetical protein